MTNQTAPPGGYEISARAACLHRLATALSVYPDLNVAVAQGTPDWRIWNVPRTTGPTTWHAKSGRYPQAHTADELGDYIRQDEAPPVEGLHTSSGC